MNELSVLITICSVFIALACLIWSSYVQMRVVKILERLNHMLDRAIEGRFTEEYYDETQLAKVETKMAYYLAASEASARQLKVEKENISKLISDISHQMKTPISNLLIYSELLMESNADDTDQDYIRAISGQSEKLRFLAEALVKLSRLEAGIITPKAEENAIYPVLEQVVSQIEATARNKQVLVSLKSTKLIAVMDAKWTGEAIFNILDNAIKYTEAGGRITISAMSYELFCRIDIEDNGIGIPEDEQTKVFGRFYRGQNAKGELGAGIGLYLAREIISVQGGYIKLKSKQNKGSIFSVFLPTTVTKTVH